MRRATCNSRTPRPSQVDANSCFIISAILVHLPIPPTLVRSNFRQFLRQLFRLLLAFSILRPQCSRQCRFSTYAPKTGRTGIVRRVRTYSFCFVLSFIQDYALRHLCSNPSRGKMARTVLQKRRFPPINRCCRAPA